MSETKPAGERDDGFGTSDADHARFLPNVTPIPTIYRRAEAAVEEALRQTDERLKELRANRAAINDEIRELVADQGRLRSMAAIARKRAGDG